MGPKLHPDSGSRKLSYLRVLNSSRKLWLVAILVVGLFTLALFHIAPKEPAHSMFVSDDSRHDRKAEWHFFAPRETPLWEQPFNFTGFDNVTGLQTGGYLVPNFVHFLRFQEEEFNFVDFVVVLAALKNQQPERVFFHTDLEGFRGMYWEKLLAIPGFIDIVEVVHMELPSHIFGQPFDNGYRIWHAGDVTRLRILMNYGGIFLDNDAYVVRSLNEFRRYEMTLGWDENQFLGTQVLLAHPNARFLNEWLETYRGAYNSSLWYYNAGERPTKEVLWRRPYLVHRVKLLFGVHYLIHKVFNKETGWLGWRDQYSVHLLIRHQAKKFNETNFMQPPTTFREMVLDVYDPIRGKPRIS